MKLDPLIPAPPRVTILMGVHNGAAHLRAQLDSIARQSHGNWQLRCSDDGSTDDSIDILHRFAMAWPGRVTLLSGPRRGFSDNYMSLLRALPENAGYVCFADQDDVWLPDKITRGISALEPLGESAALYCGRRSYWYPAQGRQTASAQMLRPFTLRNALIENVATGNTTLLNPAAAALARRAACKTGTVFAHDWWLYLVMAGTGGIIHFDNASPMILYRQHPHNAIGAGTGLIPQIKRKIGVLRGRFSERIDGNLKALMAVEDLLTPQAQDICHRFAEARQAPGLVSRLTALHSIAPYRQARSGTLGFWGAASLGCI